MREETITRAVARCLRDNGWIIYSIDYPQGGSGLTFHLADSAAGSRGRLAGAWKPDIVAHRDGVWLFMENKSFFSGSDFAKTADARESRKYEPDIERVLSERPLRFVYGIGLPDESRIQRRAEARAKEVDCVVLVTASGECRGLTTKFPFDRSG